MEALNKKLQELKETLVQDMSEEEIEKLYALPEVELLEKLNKRNHELGKRQSRYSMNSKEYTDLGKQRTLLEEVTKILRQREKEKSSLMAASDETEEINEPKEKKEIIYSREYMKQLHDEYQKLFEKNDLKSMRSLYLKVYRDFDKEPESVALLLGAFEETQRRGKGNVIGLLQFTKQREDKRGIYSLARAYRYGTLVPKSLSKSKYYLQQAVELESSEAIFELACELCGLSENYGYEIQKEEGYQQFKRYVQLRAPLDISNRRDQKALYNCYYQGAQLGHDMEKENIAVPWQWLLKCEGEYKELGKNLPGEFFVTQNRYEEAVQAFLDADNVYGIQQVKLYLFHSYFKERPELQRKLEVVLEKLRDNPNTKSEIRAELFEWYARRYENGERVVKNYAIAYAYYLKLLRIKMSNNAVERMNEITKEFSRNEKIVFFKEVFDEGGYEAAKDLGDLYQRKHRYEDAMSYYQQGVENIYDEKLREECNQGYENCRAKVNKRKANIEVSEPAYNQCRTGGISMKQSGFEQLRDLANNGNTYAALRFAQIAEADTYLRDVMKNFPKDEEIVNYYRMAAREGEVDAIMRMVQICENGELGHAKNRIDAAVWRSEL